MSALLASLCLCDKMCFARLSLYALARFLFCYARTLGRSLTQALSCQLQLTLLLPPVFATGKELCIVGEHAVSDYAMMTNEIARPITRRRDKSRGRQLWLLCVNVRTFESAGQL